MLKKIIFLCGFLCLGATCWSSAKSDISKKRLESQNYSKKIIVLTKKHLGKRKISLLKKGLKISYVGRSLPFFVLEEKNQKYISRNESLKRCKRITKNKNVLTCSPNRPILFGDGTIQEVEVDEHSDTKSTVSCLFPDNKKINYPGRTDFWAQEAVGADLVDNERQLPNVSRTPYPTFICDSFPSSSVKESLDFIPHGESVKYITDGESDFNPSRPVSCDEDIERLRLLEKLKERNYHYPPIVNHSAYFEDHETNVLPVRFSQHVHWVQIAGNFWQQDKAPQPTMLANADSWYVVGSLSPWGLPSSFSEEGSHILISAPSDSSITACSQSRGCEAFGGTSGAAPQVSHALKSILENFPHFSRDQLKKIFIKTAIKMPFNFERQQSNGAGSLNSYFAWKVAQKIGQACKSRQGRKNCIDNLIDDPKTYNFSVSPKVDLLEKNYPSCFNKGSSPSSALSCETIKEQFHNFRKAAFLEPNNINRWKTFACMMRIGGFDIGAKFYENIGRNPKARPFSYDELNITHLSPRAIRSRRYLRDPDKIFSLPISENVEEQWDLGIGLWRLGPRALPILNQLFQSGDDITQNQTMYSAARLGSIGLPLVKKGLKSESAKFGAITSLHYLGDEGLPLLRIALASEDEFERGAAIMAAPYYGEVLVPELKSMLKTDTELNVGTIELVLEQIKSGHLIQN